MREKRFGFGSIGVLLVLLFGLNGFVSAKDIVKETYQVKPPREFIYKGKCALGLGSIALTSKDKKHRIGDYTFNSRKNVVAKEGYHEHNCSRTWEEEGFSYEANTKLYPKKVVHTISYKFTKDWEGSLYINPKIDANLVVGSRYKAIDTEGNVTEGVASVSQSYTFIPPRHNLEKLELYPVDGGMISYKIENKNPLPRKGWGYEKLIIDFLRFEKDGMVTKPDVRLNMSQIPANDTFPAGYSNEIKLEIGFHEEMPIKDIHRPFTAAYYTEKPPIIDGKLDDAVWEKAEKRKDFYKSEGPETWFQIAYDKKNIYFAVECEEPDFTKIRKGDCTLPDDGNIWRDDSIELFIDPKASRSDYFQFIINFSNVLYDAKREKDVGGNTKWNAPNLQSVTRSDKDSWTLEAAIPFEDIGCSFPINEIWGFNITRNRNQTLLLSQYTTWSDVENSNHNVHLYGLVVFDKFSDLAADYLKLAGDDINPLKEELSKIPLEGFKESEWAKNRIQLLSAKEERFKKEVLSGKTFSEKQAKELFASIQSLPGGYRDLSRFIASFKTDFKAAFINPIHIKEETTLFSAKDYGFGENAVFDRQGNYVTRVKDPKPNKWAPTRLDYNLIVEKEGTYLLRAKIAAATYRPIKLFLDNRHLTSSVLSQITGSWNKAEWFNQGAIYPQKCVKTAICHHEKL